MRIKKKDRYGQELTGVRQTLTIGRSVRDLYEFCRGPRNLSLILGDMIKLEPLPGNHLHWKFVAPAGINFHGQLALVSDVPQKLLRWETADENQRYLEVSFTFRPAGADIGTGVTFSAFYDLPDGKAGEKIFDKAGFVPEAIALKILLRLKQYMETGEIPILSGSPSGHDAGTLVRS